MPIEYMFNRESVDLAEWLDVNHLVVRVHRRPGQDSHLLRYYASPTFEVMDNGMLRGATGNGSTPDAALAELARRISGTRIAVNAMGADRREIDVPTLEHVLVPSTPDQTQE